MTRKPKTMIVAGVMSGTSADGIDVALARIAPGPKLKLLSHSEFAFPKAVREAILRAAAGEMKVAELSQLNWRLGEIYADCIAKASESAGLKPALVGLHGQTIYHQASPEKFAGKPVRATWQIGEPAVVAERLRIPVVSDFRPADLAAGGQGAPLVPMLDFCQFRWKTRNRVLLNLGGIANMTAIPAGATLSDVIAFDSGPANMLIDSLMQREFGKPFDRGGKVAAKGWVLEDAVANLMRSEYFQRPAPKSCGREQFGEDFATLLREACPDARAEDVVATATALTVRSIYDAYARIVWPHLGLKAPLAKGTDLIVSGGGVRNDFLMAKLRGAFEQLGVKVMVAEQPQAKEAVAFALLAWLSFHGLPGNVPAATGASRAVVLGKITC